MFFLNLSATEFFALLGVLGGLVSLLYLLDRSKRRKVVSTLRFWTPAKSAAGQQSRKKVQDPWSFLLQLLALLLLLLAIAQLQWGTRERKGRDHILLLDSSAWSAQEQAERQEQVLDQEKARAATYIRGLPKSDRVLVARVSGIATPVTAFTNNQAQLLRAVNATESDDSALNLDQAFDFARQAQANQAQASNAGHRGDVLYIGPGMSAEESPASQPPDHLRIINVAPRRDDVGLTRVEVRRDPRTGSGWQATVSARNYGPAGQSVRVETQFDSSRFNPRLLHLGAGQEASTTVAFTTTGAGKFKVNLAHRRLGTDQPAQRGRAFGGRLHQQAGRPAPPA
jgi:hypothetical protein